MQEGQDMKTVLVNGGSRGIGAEVVRLFAGRGYRVAFTYVHSEEAAAALSAETGDRKSVV